MRKIIIIIMFFLSGHIVFSQNTTSRLTIESGGSVNFFFNSFLKYSNGITYSDWTKLDVYYNDTTDAGGLGIHPTWKLDVKALSPTIDGDAGNTLTLDVIEIEATGDPGSTGLNALSAADVSLITGGVAGISTIFISYSCGKNVSLMGESPDYYVVDIVFTLGRN